MKTGRSYDDTRPFPQRVVDGVTVIGPYSTADVDSIYALMRTVTNNTILSIGTPTEIQRSYYRGDIDLGALPADTASVTTQRSPELSDGFHAPGMEYYLSKRKRTWGVRDSSRWTH